MNYMYILLVNLSNKFTALYFPIICDKYVAKKKRNLFRQNLSVKIWKKMSSTCIVVSTQPAEGHALLSAEDIEYCVAS